MGPQEGSDLIPLGIRARGACLGMQVGHKLLRQGARHLYAGPAAVLSNSALTVLGRPLWWAGTPLPIPHSPAPPLQTRLEKLALPREQRGTDK